MLPWAKFGSFFKCMALKAVMELSIAFYITNEVSFGPVTSSITIFVRGTSGQAACQSKPYNIIVNASTDTSNDKLGSFKKCLFLT